MQTEELDRPTAFRGEHASTGRGRSPERLLGGRAFWEEASQSAGIAHVGLQGAQFRKAPDLLQSDHSSHRCGQGLKTPKLDELSGILRSRHSPLICREETGTKSGGSKDRTGRDAKAPVTRRLPPRRTKHAAGGSEGPGLMWSLSSMCLEWEADPFPGKETSIIFAGFLTGAAAPPRWHGCVLSPTKGRGDSGRSQGPILHFSLLYSPGARPPFSAPVPETQLPNQTFLRSLQLEGLWARVETPEHR